MQKERREKGRSPPNGEAGAEQTPAQSGRRERPSGKEMDAKRERLRKEGLIEDEIEDEPAA